MFNRSIDVQTQSVPEAYDPASHFTTKDDDPNNAGANRFKSWFSREWRHKNPPSPNHNPAGMVWVAMAKGSPVRQKGGRPMKYAYLLLQLDPDTLYTAGTIAMFAKEKRLLYGESEKTIRRNYQRVRIALGRFKHNHQFPKEGDGLVSPPGRQSFPGWYGWRWQQAVEGE